MAYQPALFLLRKGEADQAKILVYEKVIPYSDKHSLMDLHHAG